MEKTSAEKRLRLKFTKINYHFPAEFVKINDKDSKALNLVNYTPDK